MPKAASGAGSGATYREVVAIEARGYGCFLQIALDIEKVAKYKMSTHTRRRFAQVGIRMRLSLHVNSQSWLDAKLNCSLCISGNGCDTASP
jgi:hypothetical protein